MNAQDWLSRARGTACVLEALEYAKEHNRAISCEVAEAIEAVPDPINRAILYNRYINGLTWRQIADKLHYSNRHVYCRHKESLSQISKALEK